MRRRALIAGAMLAVGFGVVSGVVWVPAVSESVVPRVALALAVVVGAAVLLVLLRLDRMLHERTEGLAHAQQLAQVGSWSWNPADDRGEWSTEMFRIFGRDPGSGAPSRSEFVAYVAPADQGRLAAAYAAMIRGESSLELDYRIRRDDGRERVLYGLASADRQRRGRYVGTVQDVTELRVIERELREAREHAEAIITAMQEGYALTIDGTLAAVNDSMCALTGFSREQLIGAGMPFPFWPTDQLTVSRDIRERVVAAGGGTFDIELMRADGSRFDAEITAQPARREDGSLLGFVNTIRDVSERRRYESALERERRDLNHAQAIAGVGSWQYDVHADPPTRWSAQLWRMLGLDPRELTPTLDLFLAMVASGDRDRVHTALRDTIRSGEPWQGEFGLVAGDGRELVVSFRAEYSHDEHGRTRSYGTIQDISDRARRDAEEQGLRRIAELVAANAGSSAVLDAVATEVQRLFGAHSGLVTRFDESSGLGTVISAHRADGKPMEAISFSRDGDTASAMVARTGQPARIDAPPPIGADSAAEWLAANRVSGGVAAPVMVDGRLWGTLAAGFAGKPVPPEAEQRLARFARLIAMAIANAEAWQVLTRQASTDALTGLANHRTFQERLRAEVTRARRYGRDLSLVLFDLDHFKAVNDTHGHPTGDQVLAEVGRRLREQARDGELVARIGGEEFAWLMPETDRSGAYQAAERLRRLIESARFSFPETITISAGVAASQDGRGDDSDGLMRSADRALYWAKDGGRNRTFLYSHDAHALLTSQRRSPEPFQTLSGMQALALDSTDAETREHSERVAALSHQLAIALGWTAKRARLIYDCGLLHDIKDIAMPDDVLEYEQVTWIRGHREHWDGTGSPDHLSRELIPDGAQILAVADSYDLFTSTRASQPRRTTSEALAECQAQAGAQFSPAVVDALVVLTVDLAPGASPQHP